MKEFGFLSDGDIIEVKPIDLKGSSVGEAAQSTRKVRKMFSPLFFDFDLNINSLSRLSIWQKAKFYS